MYRIELKPGEESVFRTIEELAIGIRNGLITSRARIYHNASQKWLPIEFHPHYKKALEMPAATSVERPAVGVASPRGSAHAPAPARVPVAAPALAPAPAPMPLPVPVPVAAGAGRGSSPGLVFVEVEAPEIHLGVAEVPVFDSAVPSPVGELPHITYSESGRGSARRPRPLHLGVAAAVLMAGAYVAVSAALPSRKTAAEQAPARQTADVAAPVIQEARVDSAPARNSASVPPSSNGPTFGGDLAAQSASKRPVTTSIGASPAATPHADSDSIEPPPVNVDLSIPSLPQGDSLAPVSTNDSNAMRRILRAVGGKGAPAAPVQP
jgi:hypothetical protein